MAEMAFDRTDIRPAPSFGTNNGTNKESTPNQPDRKHKEQDPSHAAL
jgi:hypothetical protein